MSEDEDILSLLAGPEQLVLNAGVKPGGDVMYIQVDEKGYVITSDQAKRIEELENKKHADQAYRNKYTAACQETQRLREALEQIASAVHHDSTSIRWIAKNALEGEDC